MGYMLSVLICVTFCYLLSMASMFDAFRTSVQVPKKDGISRVHAFNMIFDRLRTSAISVSFLNSLNSVFVVMFSCLAFLACPRYVARLQPSHIT